MFCRRELEVQLQDLFQNKLAVSKKNLLTLQGIMFEKHNMLGGIVNQYVLGHLPLTEITVEKLLWFANGVKFLEDIDINKYFSKSEIVSFENSKCSYEKEACYPVIFDNILKVTDDQWIVVKDVNFLYTLYNQQLINYNKNTQRPVTVKTVNGVETYSVTVKEKSVKQISNLMKQGLFIPNAITLNLNGDSQDLDFVIEEDKILLLTGQLDIVDGYHRFRAMMEEKGRNGEFNYSVIINLTNFDEVKACSYIAQEDKRNQLDRQYSKSLDGTNLTNLV